MTKQKPDPANKRVECSFNVSRLVAQAQLKPSQRHYLLLLCGEQYDPATDTVTLSCEKFDERIYNKIYLSDTVDRLIKEVKVGFESETSWAAVVVSDSFLRCSTGGT